MAFYALREFDIALEDQVTQLAGARIEQDVEKVLGWVRAAGIDPVARETFPIPRRPQSHR